MLDNLVCVHHGRSSRFFSCSLFVPFLFCFFLFFFSFIRCFFLFQPLQGKWIVTIPYLLIFFFSFYLFLLFCFFLFSFFPYFVLSFLILFFLTFSILSSCFLFFFPLFSAAAPMPRLRFSFGSFQENFFSGISLK